MYVCVCTRLNMPESVPIFSAENWHWQLRVRMYELLCLYVIFIRMYFMYVRVICVRVCRLRVLSSPSEKILHFLLAFAVGKKCG